MGGGTIGWGRGMSVGRMFGGDERSGKRERSEEREMKRFAPLSSHKLLPEGVEAARRSSSYHLSTHRPLPAFPVLVHCLLVPVHFRLRNSSTQPKERLGICWVSRGRVRRALGEVTAHDQNPVRLDGLADQGEEGGERLAFGLAPFSSLRSKLATATAFRSGVGSSGAIFAAQGRPQLVAFLPCTSSSNTTHRSNRLSLSLRGP
jgi:hypothetical protein